MSGPIKTTFGAVAATQPKTKQKKRPAPFPIRLSPEEHAYLEHRAGNRPLGTYAREVLLGELHEILSAEQIDLSRLSAPVKKTLQNPRVLAIAFELLDNAHIQDFQELSVERLLFEHFRISARDGNSAEPPETFIGRFSSHAQEIINRVNRQKHEDKLIFESADFAGAPRYELSADLLALSEERFSKALSDRRQEAWYYHAHLARSVSDALPVGSGNPVWYHPTVLMFR